MKTHNVIEHVRMRPGMYCPLHQCSSTVFQMAMRYFIDSHIAGCSKRLHIDFDGNTVKFRDYGTPIPFETMNGEKIYAFRRWTNFGEFYGMSGSNPVVPIILMGLSKEMELTSFHAGRKKISRSVDNARCGQECNTSEPDGIEMRITHEKIFDPAYIHGLTLQFHALFPELEICINGCQLPTSTGLSDLLFWKLEPGCLWEPVFAYRSKELDLSAALLIGQADGPHLFSYLDCFETSEGGDHNNEVLNVLQKLKMPFPINKLCLVFHCKQTMEEVSSDAIQEKVQHAPPALLLEMSSKTKAFFSSPAAQKDFSGNIQRILQDELKISENDEKVFNPVDECQREPVARLIKKYIRPGDDNNMRSALEIAIVHRKASISYLQRMLKIGFNQAAFLMNQLEERGIVGPASETGNGRIILIEKPQDWTE